MGGKRRSHASRGRRAAGLAEKVSFRGFNARERQARALLQLMIDDPLNPVDATMAPVFSFTRFAEEVNSSFAFLLDGKFSSSVKSTGFAKDVIESYR